jgi:hypothetical protein
MERAARDPAQTLPAGVRDFLGARLNKWLPVVRVHQGPAADELAASLQADAVTFGERIAFRHRRYEPDQPRGVALLGHELAHVAARAAPRAAANPAEEERAALTHEHSILHELAAPAAVRAAPAAIVPPPAAAPPGPLRTAREDRPVPSPPAAEALSARQMAQIKDQVYRDLLQRLRTDFERGS